MPVVFEISEIFAFSWKSLAPADRPEGKTQHIVRHIIKKEKEKMSENPDWGALSFWAILIGFFAAAGVYALSANIFATAAIMLAVTFFSGYYLYAWNI